MQNDLHICVNFFSDFHFPCLFVCSGHQSLFGLFLMYAKRQSFVLGRTTKLRNVSELDLLINVSNLNIIVWVFLVFAYARPIPFPHWTWMMGFLMIGVYLLDCHIVLLRYNPPMMFQIHGKLWKKLNTSLLDMSHPIHRVWVTQHWITKLNNTIKLNFFIAKLKIDPLNQ